ncbi:Importin subunit alpha-4 [Thelohanellus kitauei]|uniref:Importin subunit alpha-4 n=1 Tax=Thelohanellus kitauei TaxID=669202 RepID=A0A0C2IY70_THEKT|nr:Importin subunit alpha-4 [Thelohanellus kitauei]
MTIDHKRQTKENLHMKCRVKTTQKQLNEFYHFSHLLNLTDSPDEEAVYEAVKLMRIKLSEPLQRNQDFHQNKTTRIKYEAAWGLVNICSEGHEETRLTVENNGIACFLSLLLFPNHKYIEIAVWGIGNIIDGSEEYRDMVVQQNYVEIIWRTLQKNLNDDCNRRIAWTMVNICRNWKNQLGQTVLELIMTIFMHMFTNCNDIEVHKHITVSIFLLIEQNPLIIDVLIVFDFVATLKKLLLHSETELQTCIMKIFGVISSSHECHVQKVIECGIFEILPVLISSSCSQLRREVLIFLSGISAGKDQLKALIFQYNLLPGIIYHLHLKNEYVNQREAIWILCDILKSNNVSATNSLVNHGIIAEFGGLLSSEDYHVRIN